MFFKSEKEYYSCKCLEETLILHHDWYGICSMYAHRNANERPQLNWENDKINLKKLISIKKKIIKQNKSGNIFIGCIGCKDLQKGKWSGKCDKIKHIHFRLSIKCNAKCIYCPDHIDNMSIGRPFLNELKIMVKKKLIDQNTLIEFGGGEPTLHEEFEEMVEYLLSEGFHNFKFYSSALIYSKGFEKALSFDQCDVIISTDAGDRETHTIIKQEDTYDKQWNNLEKYVKAQNTNKFQVKAKYIILNNINDNKEKIDLFLQKAQSIGIREVRFDFEKNASLKLLKNNDIESIKSSLDLLYWAKIRAEKFYNFKFSLHAVAETLVKHQQNYWKCLLKNYTVSKING